MYDVLDVCRYIINYSNEKNSGISNLKLQKILYFIQAQFLVSENEVCFSDAIEAWDFGPVVPRAYREYKQFGAMNIPMIYSYFKTDPKNFWNVEEISFDENVIKQHDRNIISYVVNAFANYSATVLVELTHKQDPWKNAYSPGNNLTITHDEIKRYFNDNR